MLKSITLHGPTLWSRRLVKTAVAATLCRARVETALGSWLRLRTPFVMGYHRVVEACDGQHAAMPGMLVSRAMLERHLDWVGRRYRFVTLDELGTRVARGDHGEPLAAVTFDDGYRDVYENAAPLLVRKGIPAAFFIVAGLVDRPHLQMHDRVFLGVQHAMEVWGPHPKRLAERLAFCGLPTDACRGVQAAAASAIDVARYLLRSQSAVRLAMIMRQVEIDTAPLPTPPTGLLPMTASMVRSLGRQGFTIGSHTMTHPVLPNEPESSVRYELRESRQALETIVGGPVVHFAYPDGGFNSVTVRAVKDAGYRSAYTTCRHRDPHAPQLTIPRRLLWQDSSVDVRGEFSPVIFRCQAYGVLAGRPACKGQSHA